MEDAHHRLDPTFSEWLLAMLHYKGAMLRYLHIFISLHSTARSSDA
jgi:hypothetical protein